MLQEIPARLREHAKGKLADHAAAKSRLAEIERRALIADGVEAAEARVESAEVARKAGEETVANATAELQQIEADRQRALGAGQDAVTAGAIDLLAQDMAHDDLKQLYQEALRTPGKEDERAVEAISQAREALRKADAEVGQIRAEIRELAKRRSELEGSRDRARRVGFDNPMGTFPDQSDIGRTIGAILAGALRGSDLDRVLRDNYRRPQPRVDPDFGGGSWPGSAWPGPSWPGSGDGPLGQGPWSGTPGPGGGGSDDEGWRTDGRF
jgi:hypothetical protein